MSRADSKKQSSTKPSKTSKTSKRSPRDPTEITIDPWKSIIVENVPVKCTEKMLAAHLKATLKISKVWIVHTDNAKGCQTAIVTLDSAQERYKALGQLGGESTIDGVTLRFKKYARDQKRNHTIKIGDVNSGGYADVTKKTKKPAVRRQRSRGQKEAFKKKRRRRRSKRDNDADTDSASSSFKSASSSFKSTSSEESSTKENAKGVNPPKAKVDHFGNKVDRSDIVALMEECRLLMEQNSLNSEPRAKTKLNI